MIYRCCHPRRRELVLANPPLNGIDFLEVLDGEAPPGTPRQRTLLLRFLRTAPALTLDDLELSGGERITGVGLLWITRADAPDPALAEPGLIAHLATLDPGAQAATLMIRTDSQGDHARYRLRLTRAGDPLSPPDGIDRLLAEIDFSFKVECATDFDCAPRTDCAPDTPTPLAISYLAKDYRSFRRLMLGRMAQIMPDWRERNPADLGIALVEMLAYTGDRLSYAQDAVATESYLATARRRSSVRRHARLVDYRMHDGANARVWVQVRVTADVTAEAADLQFLTRLPGLEPVLTPDQRERALDRDPQVFEPLHGGTFRPGHNRIDFYTWGSDECCLPRGATRATLAGDLPDLAPGDILVLAERLGPRTGRAADADPTRRHAVRLRAVQAGLTDPLPLEPGADPAPITEIRWAEDDALPFALCLSARRDDAAGGGVVTGVSHALGNIVLADHGRSITNEPLGRVPEPHLSLVPAPGPDPCTRPDPRPVPPRFAPPLALGPVTQAAVIRDSVTGDAVAYDPLATRSAHEAIHQPLAARAPAVTLTDDSPAHDDWQARADLLNSFAGDRHFVVETERDGRARIRFGDDLNGRRPNAGTGFAARYRVGNGAEGNVGAGAIAHVITGKGGIEAVTNPLPATGGLGPETMDEVRAAAPFAYRRQERAVTEADYGEMARRHPDVQRAVATFRWNGHGHTVFVTVDRFGGRPVTPEFRAELAEFLERYRMAGYDLQIDAPRFVALEIALFVCAAPDHFRSEIRRELLQVLSTQRLPGGRTGLFHPDNFSFGDPVWLSRIHAAAMGVTGVSSVKATLFRRRGTTSAKPLEDGVIRMGRLEIAQCENDRNFPERGALTITMGGGK
ncbi:putative baseplate assembly protein [Rhodovulum strictum]|uniref:Putative baseplate assembly protein n=1 Tax=Rhodovulum strictum TaxID=58314 RepID=A0A844B6K5_9RHOB|nr:putative baseplate assembly protein [Rhodovulum strictum]MRH20014.1 putative baseplate assembly protein [Rhodovulum strictum]